MSNQKSISWTAPEFKYYEKSIGWYITVITVSVLVIGFFVVIESDIFAAVSLAILAVLALIFAQFKPREVDIELTERGIHFGTLFYPYKQIKYFWVVHNLNHQTINFHTNALVNNVVILELQDQDPEEIRKYLIQFLIEHHETRETPIQRIMHIFNF